MVIAPFFFFFNDTATTEIYTLSLHDALPICSDRLILRSMACGTNLRLSIPLRRWQMCQLLCRSEEHTSELQSQSNLVCRLLLEKKNEFGSYGNYRGADRSREGVAVQPAATMR